MMINALYIYIPPRVAPKNTSENKNSNYAQTIDSSILRQSSSRSYSTPKIKASNISFNIKPYFTSEKLRERQLKMDAIVEESKKSVNKIPSFQEFINDFHNKKPSKTKDTGIIEFNSNNNKKFDIKEVMASIDLEEIQTSLNRLEQSMISMLANFGKSAANTNSNIYNSSEDTARFGLAQLEIEQEVIDDSKVEQQPAKPVATQDKQIDVDNDNSDIDAIFNDNAPANAALVNQHHVESVTANNYDIYEINSTDDDRLKSNTATKVLGKIVNDAAISENSFEKQPNQIETSNSGKKVMALAVGALEKIIPAASASELQNATQTPKACFSTDEDLDVGLGKKLLIGSGRAFVKTGQGIKQLGLAAGEKLSIVEDGTTANYTAVINKEKKLYDSTPVGQSTTAKVGEVLTDVAIAVAVPGGSGATGTKLVAGSAGTGAFISGMQATEDGSLSSRAQNASVGAIEGAVGGYVFSKTAQGLHWAWQEGKVQHGLYTFDSKVKVSHVFSKTKGSQAPKCGHVLDTAENRRIITETFTDKKNFVGTNEHGSDFYAKLLPDGNESWVRVDNGVVKSAGINNVPRYFTLNGASKPNHNIIKRPKP